MNEKKFLETFGQRLRLAREKAKLTQAELAEKVDLSSNFIGMVERGERNTKLANVYKLVQALNITLEEFFRGL